MCVTRTTRPDGTIQPVDSLAGTWTVRAFPPAGVTGRGVATANLGAVASGEDRDVALALPEQATPPYIDPSGIVVDTEGAPVAGATVTLWRSDVLEGPFTIVPDGDGFMSPANRQNPDSTTDAGEFRWDVLAGWYKVTATAPGAGPWTANRPLTRARSPSRRRLWTWSSCSTAARRTLTSR